MTSVRTFLTLLFITMSTDAWTASSSEIYADPNIPLVTKHFSVADVYEIMAQMTTRLEPIYRKAMTEIRREGIEVRRDIIYSKMTKVDTVRQSLDLYLPSSDSERCVAIDSPTCSTAAPIILYVHGGGWIAGGKEQSLFKPLAFVPNGFVFASTNYPFLPKISVAEMAKSVADAVGWLRRHSTEFGGDPERIFLVGHSAGAHLVSLLATNTSFLEQAGVPMASIRGVVSLDTLVYNLPKLISSPAGGFHTQLFVGNKAFLEKISPWHHISDGADQTPFLIFYSDGRPDAINQTIPFGARMRSAGQEAIVVEAAGRSHDSLHEKLGTPGDEATALILEFIRRHAS